MQFFSMIVTYGSFAHLRNASNVFQQTTRTNRLQSNCMPIYLTFLEQQQQQQLLIFISQRILASSFNMHQTELWYVRT